MSVPKRKYETALTTIILPEIPQQQLIIDQITKETHSILNCTPLDPFEESKPAHIFHLCYEQSAINSVEQFYATNAFTKIVKFDTQTQEKVHETIKSNLTQQKLKQTSLPGTKKIQSNDQKSSVLLFCNYWIAVEKVFTEKMRYLFRKLRQELEEIEVFVFRVKSLYLGYFERPFEIFTRFDGLIDEYNDVEFEIR